MAEHLPPFGRGRGRGLLKPSSFSPIYQLVPLVEKSVRKTVSFSQNLLLKNSSPRHTIVNFTSTSSHVFPRTKTSQISKTTMPSPSLSDTPVVAPQDSNENWTTVPPKRKNPPILTQLPHSDEDSFVPTDNRFEALSDNDDDVDLTSPHASTDLSPALPASSTKKLQKDKKLKKKKTKLKKRRKSKSRGTLQSDTDMESDDNLPPQLRSPATVSPTQKQFYDDDDEESHSITTPSPVQESDDTELVDSDHTSTPSPPLKNSDIRSYYTRQSSSISTPTPSPSRTRAIGKLTSSLDIATFPPRALLNLLIQSKKDLSQAQISTLRTSSYREIRFQLMQHFRSLQQATPDIRLDFTTDSYGFFDATTLDWEIKSLGHTDSTTIILAIQSHNTSLKFCDFENLSSMHDIITITRDKMKTNNSKKYFNLFTYSTTPPVTIDLTSEDPPPQTPPPTPDSTIAMDFSASHTGGLSQVPDASDNQRLGINMNMMMAQPIATNPHRPPPVSDSSPQPPAVPITQMSARFEISPSTVTTINVPLVARQLFRIFKQADRTIRLLPWTTLPTDDLSSIDQEDDIPSSEDDVQTWINNPRLHNNRLHFAMRIESIAKPKHIRDTFVPWMQKNNSFIKLDTLAAKDIYGIGFITDLHPNLYNRMRLKSFIQQELRKQKLDIEINTYVRNVWGVYQGDKISAKAVVIEVDRTCKDVAASALMDINFLAQYRYAKFVPFNKAIVPDEVLYNILLENNYYQTTSRRRTVKGLSSIFISHPTLTETTSSVQQWLLSMQVPPSNSSNGSDSQDTYLFEHVEPSVSNDTVIIYPTHYESEVSTFLNHFEEQLRSYFLHPIDIFDPDQPLTTGRSRPVSNGEAYGKKLAALYNFNPQEAPQPTPSPPKPTRLYYGAAKNAEDTYLNHLTQKSPPKKPQKKASPTRIEPSPPPSQDDTILRRLDKLEESNKLLAQSVDNRFKDLTQRREDEQNKMILAVTSAVTNIMTSSLPQLIADQLKVASAESGSETS